MAFPAAESPGSQPTLRAISNVVGASITSRFLRVARALAIARLLAPEEYGVAATLALILTYAQFLDLGSSLAAFRDLTSAIGRGDPKGADRAAAWMSALKLATALPVAAGAVAALLVPGVPPLLRLGLVALPLMAVSSTLLSQALLHLQAKGAVRDFSRTTAIAAFSDLVVGVGFTWLWSLPGLLAGTALSPLLPLAWAAARGAGSRPALPGRQILRGYAKTGLPLVALAFLDLSLVSIDQLVVLTLLSVHDLGLYNIALVAPEAVRILGMGAGVVFGPQLLREYARSGGRLEAIRRQTLAPVQLYAAALPLPIALLWIGGSFFVTRFYPAYLDAVPPMQLLLLAIDFLVVTTGVTTFLFAIDRHPRNLLILTAALCFNVALDVALIQAGWALRAVAAGSLVTYFLYALVVLSYVASHFEFSWDKWLRFQVGALLPGIFLGLALTLIERFFPYQDTLSRTAVACALVMLLFAPLAVRAVFLAHRMDEIRP